MNKLVDVAEVEKLIKAETDQGWYSVPVDLLRALLDRSPSVEASPPVEVEPVRVELGHGKYGIHYGNLEGVPCLSISDKGTGVVGEPTDQENLTNLELKHEIVTITFLNKQSYEVFKKTVETIPEFKVESESDTEALEAKLKIAVDGSLEAKRCAEHASKAILGKSYPEANGAIMLCINHLEQALKDKE